MSPRFPDPFRPVAPGLEARISKWLIPAYLTGLAVPALVGVWAHLLNPPGPPDFAREKWLELLDMMCLGAATFDSVAVFTVALGCLIVTLMKSHPRHADPMPPPAG